MVRLRLFLNLKPFYIAAFWQWCRRLKAPYRRPVAYYFQKKGFSGQKNCFFTSKNPFFQN